MSTQSDTPAEPASPSPTRRTMSRWAAPGVVVAVAVALVALALISGDDDTTPADTSQRIAATQAACRQWMDSAPNTGSSAPDPQWCRDMSRWMNDQLADGSMMGSMMWASPQAMVNACQDWATTTAGPSPAGWCDEMVAWMSQHMGTWHDGQDWDDHMGDGHWGDGMMGQ